MFLQFGLNKHHDMIHVSAVQRGRVDLVCPYCGAGLIARKGQKLAHHFAHDGESCRESSSRDGAQLPAYQKFDLSLSSGLWKNLQNFHRGHPVLTSDKKHLAALDLLKFNSFAGRSGNYELTPMGKVPFGEATLAAFANVQRELIEKKHNRLLYNLERAQTKVDKQLTLTDFNLYCAQLRRLLLSTLYFLEIKADGEKFYKIGVTSRQVSERAKEVELQLKRRLLNRVQIKVLRELPGQGLVEHYFKHRFGDNKKALGSFTEYFEFDSRRNVLSELTRLGARALSELEQAIIDEQLPDIAQQTHEELYTHSGRVRLGMKRAAAAGQHVGRPAEGNQAIIDKYPHVVAAIEQGLSRRKAAKETAVSVPTVRKVHEALLALERRQQYIELVLNPPKGWVSYSLAVSLAQIDFPHCQNPFSEGKQSEAWRGYKVGANTAERNMWKLEQTKRKMDQLLQLKEGEQSP